MKPSTERCLARLRAAEGAWISGNALADAVGWRYGARLYELRAAGFVIERRSSKRSAVDEYRIVEHPVQLELGVAS
jgi:hypothetical protein